MDILSVGLTEGKSFTTKVNNVLSVKVEYLGDACYAATSYLYGIEAVKVNFNKSDITNFLKAAMTPLS